MTEKQLLISFKLHLSDKIESERNLISIIERHLNGTDLITDEDIPTKIRLLCKANAISFESVVAHAKEMFQ